MKRALLLIMLMMPVTALAETYSWTDASGTMHFTDDPGKIPRQYRKKAEQRDVYAPPASPAQAPAATKDNEKPNTATAPTPTAQAPAAYSATTRFGSRSGAEWQAEFRSINERLKVIDQQFEQVQKEGGDGKTPISREKVDELNTRNKILYEEHEALRLRYNLLVEQANTVGLPPEFSK